jgi:glucosamine kinase
MIFIIESGSTKSDWVLIDDKNNQSFYKTIGFNPYFHSADVIESEIRKNEELTALVDDIDRIYFYGAGCSSSDLNNIVLNGLGSVFTSAKIIVEHDLLACAYATYDGKPGISCILGTGSNSCYFDGNMFWGTKGVVAIMVNFCFPVIYITSFQKRFLTRLIKSLV